MSEVAVVFVHGFLAFPGLGFCGYRRLGARLRLQGVPFASPTLPATAPVAERAVALAKAIGDLPYDRIHLVGHSMGGLDSRFLIRHLDPNHRVVRLTTIATPHCGSPLAELALSGYRVLPTLIGLLGRDALCDLTPDACATFNRAVPDRPDVEYVSFAGARPAAEQAGLLRPYARFLAAAEGENDGMVSVASARWGRFARVLPADHLELIGWNLSPRRRAFPHLAFFRDLIALPAGDALTNVAGLAEQVPADLATTGGRLRAPRERTAYSNSIST
jgi:triacylglycerol lipase